MTPPGGSRVLLVDDSPQVAGSTRRLLELEGFTVRVAPTGEAAVEALEEDSAAVDVVILDLVLPGIDGFETFARLRRLRARLPCIVYSGFGHHAEVEGLVAQGARFLAKPFLFEDLLRALREVTDPSA